jgi:hypothetical protein
MGKIKLVYKDGNSTKVLWGQIVGEDNVFISFRTEDDNYFRINKISVISIKEVGGRDGF